MRIISYLLFLVGSLCLIYSVLLFVQRTTPARISFSRYEAPKKQFTTREQPTRLRISNAQIDIPLLPAPQPRNTWTVSDKGALYLTSSPIPGSLGNSIIYGHNWTQILGNLTQAKPGDIVDIDFNNGQTLHFKIETKGVVTPDQTHVLNNSKDARITIYTCTGFFDTKRLVVTATFLGSSSVRKSVSNLNLL